MVNDQLVQLSGQPGIADLAFRTLRSRWSRTKGTDALAAGRSVFVAALYERRTINLQMH